MSVQRISKEKYEFIFPIYLVECKNIQSPLVFFSREEVKSRFVIGDLHLSGIPTEIRTKDGFDEELVEYLGLENVLHYYKSAKISTQFCVIVQDKSKGFIATHKIDGPMGNLYQTMILPLIKAVYYEKEQHQNSFVYDPKGENINLQFYYPIVVINGSLYECSTGKGKQPVYRKKKRIAFLRRYESAKVSGEYRIDIVTREGFKDLLTEIETEMGIAARRIRRKRTVLVENANRIAKDKVKGKS
jgi:hypothetical protein